MTEIEDYVQFEAAFNHWRWDTLDKAWKFDVDPLPMVPCSADEFYEPYGPLRTMFLKVIPLAYCI